MRSLWPIVILAIGLGVLHVAISIVFGPGIASALVAGIGIAYAAYNSLLGKPKDDPEAKQLLARLFAVGKVTWATIALVWLSAVTVAAYPLVDRMLSEEFTIAVVDERRQPAGDAQVEIRFGDSVRRVALTRGVGTVRYYPSLAPKTAEIIIDNKGVRQTIVHRMDADGRYPDLVIPVWSGEPPLSVTHLTATGVAIDAFLHGDLPEELRERYPRVTVMRGPVFDTAAEFVKIYRDFASSSPGMKYSRADSGGGNGPKRVEATALEEGGGDAWMQRYWNKVKNLRYAEQVSGEVELDFSSELLGAPADQPLPDGFLARMNNADDYALGTKAVPDASTEAWIRGHLGEAARGPNGEVSLAVERLLTAADLAYLLSRETRSDPAMTPDPVLHGYLRYMEKHNLPAGLIRAFVHLDPDISDCAFTAPHVRLFLPEPELRVTILKNNGDKPVKIDELVLTLQTRDGLQRAAERAPQQESRLPFDVLAPGEAVLVPRELSIKAIYTDAEVAEFRAPSTGPTASFRLLPQPPMPRPGAEIDPAAPLVFQSRPRSLKLPAARLRPARADELIPEGKSFAQRGPAYVVGPSASEVDYVVNGVRIRARSDNRTAIAMIGGWETGSCPFVFAHFQPGQSPLNLGQIITNQIGSANKRVDRMSIPAGFAGIEVRERENEISYLDSARLAVRRPQGVVRYPARNRELIRDDGRYAVLRKGEQLTLDFGYVRRAGDGDAVLEVTGYYDPVRLGTR